MRSNRGVGVSELWGICYLFCVSICISYLKAVDLRTNLNITYKRFEHFRMEI